MNKKLWSFYLLGVLGVFGVFEGISMLDGDPSTITLTSFLVNTIPMNWFFAIFGALAVWAFAHFIKSYLVKDGAYDR